MSTELWKTKLAAWIHDPAEKALILLRDRTGHEWGTVARLREELGIPHGLSPKRADWYASAADRPQWPLSEKDGRYPTWCQVDFAARPALRHPLSGREYLLEKLIDLHPEHLKAVSEEHFRSLIVRDDDGKPDLALTYLAYWRFGSEPPAQELNHLWQNLPADTRVPDHSIWAHLDLVSAFAGAMSADTDETPALLSVSFGPVQGFISEARTTSDLWAGSHLLARIAWEGMKVVCETLGPDAVLFPNLRGVPAVDAWLYDKLKEVDGLRDRFESMLWRKSRTDANPLFAAALPNRFVAIVPADRAEALAEAVTHAVRRFMYDTGERALRRLLREIREEWADKLPCAQQLREQLKGFPEVHWAAVPWSLTEGAGSGARSPVDDARLRSALAPFYPEGADTGFLDSSAWHVLSDSIELEGARFYQPNPGVLYPALYDLLDRLSAAAKAVRPFDQTRQQGYRSSLNGEREWLTLNRDELALPPGKRIDTLWTRIAEKRPSWAKKGEHLDALAAIKRLWPTLFAEQLRETLGVEVRRYVVSTHTLALAVSMERWLDESPRAEIPPRLRNLLESNDAESAALPRRLVRKLRDNDAEANLLCRRLPGTMEALQDAPDEQSEAMRQVVMDGVKSLFGDKPEAYYGVLLFDGDRMGAWLSGGAGVPRLSYGDCWHEQVRVGVENRFKHNKELADYLSEKRAPSPARHRSISEALNHFSLDVARFVVEDCFKGKLVYSGGDDVLAFVCVDDLMPAMALLRCLYSGMAVPRWLDERLDIHVRSRFDSKAGYLKLDTRLMLTMGEMASGSAGAVVAHYQSPLGHVLRELRAAERAAKEAGGRDAWNLRVIKRAGGALGLTAKWRESGGDDTAMELLEALRLMLSDPGVSRRAAYHSVTWLAQMPTVLGSASAADRATHRRMLESNLAHRFARQSGDRCLAIRLAGHVCEHADDPNARLENMLMVAEFLARNTRNAIGGGAAEPYAPEEAVLS